MPGGLKFDFTFGAAQRPTPRDADDPLRILVLGDFSGSKHSADTASDLSQRAVMRVDLDTFDRVLGRVAPQVTLALNDGQPGVTVTLEKLDHFHPDELYARLALFQALRAIRERLKNPVTFAGAAAELRVQKPEVDDTAETMKRPALKLPDDDTETLSRLLGQPPAASRPATAGASARPDLQSLIRSVVAPHIVSNDMPFQEQYLAAVDAAAGGQMRALLHHPVFQELEANWRGLRLLVDSLDLDEVVRLEIMDITREELRADLERAGSNLQGAALHRLLSARARGPEPEPCSLLVGLYSFGPSESDVAMLAAIGSVAAQNGVPFLAAADAGVVGCRSFVENPEPGDWNTSRDEATERWQALRSAPFASWIGLSTPRLLMRLPYGKSTDATETFAFEELVSGRRHDQLLWANSALACALLVGRSFMEEGWQMEPGGELEIDDLPSFTHEQDGERRLQACAEAFLGDRAAQAILERGVMPMLSFRNRNAVRLMRLQSLASPPAPLSGPWQTAQQDGNS